MRRFRIAALILLGVALGASVALNFKLAGAVAQAYAGELRARLEPLGPPGPPLKKGQRRIALVGDSRAAQWPLSIPGAEVVNLAVPGHTSAQTRLRAERLLARARHEITIIEVGVNDLKAIAMMPERRAEIEANLRLNLAEIVAGARASGSRVIVCTVFPRGPLKLVDRWRWSAEVEAAILDLNTHIRATYPGALDAAQLLSEDGRVLRAEFAADLLHLSPAGYDRLNKELLPRLKR